MNLTDREKEGGEMEKGGEGDTKKEKRKKDFKEFSFENPVVLYALLKVSDSKKGQETFHIISLRGQTVQRSYYNS